MALIQTSVSVKPRLHITAHTVENTIRDISVELDELYGWTRLSGRLFDRREHTVTNDLLMNALDRWEDRNGFKRQR
jgi:hypothetical protein